jgi:hypothetical protein
MKNATWMILLVAMAGCGGGSSGGSASEGGSSGSSGSESAAAPSAPASATQFVQAIDAALAVHPNARVFEVEIDDTHHVGFLEVEYFEDETAREIFFDPGTMAVIADVDEAIEPGEAEAVAAVRTHLAAGQGDLRARIEDGSFTSHAIETVQELELTILDGHYVIACEVLRDGERVTMFHAIDGSYLGQRDDALAYLAQHPELEVR